MTEIDASPATAPPLTEQQRNVYAALSAVVRLADCAGMALVPGPTWVSVYVPHHRRPGCYSLLRQIDLPQIKTEPLGRHAGRRKRAQVAP